MKPLVVLPAQGAELLGCSKSTFNRWSRRGDFPAPIVIVGTVGRRWFVADLTAWMKRQQIPFSLLPAKAGMPPRDLPPMIGPASPGE